MPKGSIWFHFSRGEMINFIRSNPSLVPADTVIDYDALEDGDVQAIDVEQMEAAIARAGLSIVTLFD